MVKVYKRTDDVNYTFQDLLEIMSKLRSKDGCPWDKEQTHESIRNSVIEEAYETVDAIDSKNTDGLVEELGDLLLQIVFHSQIGYENGEFDIDDVIHGICSKLIYRHPHIFGNETAGTSEEVLDNWDKLKSKEKNFTSYTQTLNAVPKAFPACMRAQKVQKRAGKAGCKYNDAVLLLTTVENKISKLKEEIKTGKNTSGEEIGKILFDTVGVAEFLKTDAEEQLSNATDNFIASFAKSESSVTNLGLKVAELTEKQRKDLWKDIIK